MLERINGQPKISKYYTKIKKSRTNPAIILSTNEQQFATKKMSQKYNDSIMSTAFTEKSKKCERKSVTIQASVQTNSFAKRGESTVQKAGIKMLDKVDEGCKGSTSKKIGALVLKEDSDALAPYSIPTVACNGRSKGSRRNRRRPKKME
jgi:DNA integrity scanning protein DisA with diadenylate cyclase activity